jgi:hypothetical protein
MEEHISRHALLDGKALQADIAAAFVTVATNRSNCCYSTMSSQLSTANTCCRTYGVAYIIWSSG